MAARSRWGGWIAARTGWGCGWSDLGLRLLVGLGHGIYRDSEFIGHFGQDTVHVGLSALPAGLTAAILL